MGGRREQGPEQALSLGLREGKICERLAHGGGIRNVLVVPQNINGTVERLVCIRASWRRTYLPLRLWGDKADRTYRGMGLLLSLILDEFCYRRVISVYLEDDRRLARYKIVGSGQLGSVKQSEIAVEEVPPREQ